MVQCEVNQYLLLGPLILDTVLKSTTYTCSLFLAINKIGRLSNGKLLVRCILISSKEEKRRNWVIYSMLSISAANPKRIQQNRKKSCYADRFSLFFQFKTIILIYFRNSQLSQDEFNHVGTQL